MSLVQEKKEVYSISQNAMQTRTVQHIVSAGGRRYLLFRPRVQKKANATSPKKIKRNIEKQCFQVISDPKIFELRV